MICLSVWAWFAFWYIHNGVAVLRDRFLKRLQKSTPDTFWETWASSQNLLSLSSHGIILFLHRTCWLSFSLSAVASLWFLVAGSHGAPSHRWRRIGCLYIYIYARLGKAKTLHSFFSSAKLQHKTYFATFSRFPQWNEWSVRGVGGKRQRWHALFSIWTFPSMLLLRSP